MGTRPPAGLLLGAAFLAPLSPPCVCMPSWGHPLAREQGCMPLSHNTTHTGASPATRRSPSTGRCCRARWRRCRAAAWCTAPLWRCPTRSSSSKRSWSSATGYVCLAQAAACSAACPGTAMPAPTAVCSWWLVPQTASCQPRTRVAFNINSSFQHLSGGVGRGGAP